MRKLTDVEKMVISKAILEKRKVNLMVVNESARVRPFYKCAGEERGEFITGAEYLDDLFTDETAKGNKKFFESVKKAAIDIFTISEDYALKGDGDRTPAVLYQHGQTFDLSIPQDCAKYLRLFIEDDVALSAVAVNRAQHVFYVEDKAAEASHKLNLLKKKASAIELIETRIEGADKDAILTLLKLGNIQNMTLSEKDLALYKCADETPNKIIALFSDVYFSKKLILQKLILNKAISYNPHKSEYKIGDMLVATSFDTLIKWSEEEANQQIFNDLLKSLAVAKA